MTWEDQCEWHRMTRMTGPDCAVMCNLINMVHTQEDQCEWHRMTRMTGPNCAGMCNLINTHTHTRHEEVGLSRLSGPCANFKLRKTIWNTKLARSRGLAAFRFFWEKHFDITPSPDSGMLRINKVQMRLDFSLNTPFFVAFTSSVRISLDRIYTNIIAR